MRSRKGFTMIELMVVVLIVAVLAAILVPYLTARLEAARWSEGKAGCGSLATSIRATWAEQGEENWTPSPDPAAYLTAADMKGKYFSIGDYSISFGTASTTYPVAYIITVHQPNPLTTGTVVKWTKGGYSLDYTGKWSELSAVTP